MLTEQRNEIKRRFRYEAFPTRYVTHAADFYDEDFSTDEPVGIVVLIIKYNSNGKHFYAHSIIYNNMIDAVMAHPESIKDYIAAKANEMIQELEHHALVADGLSLDLPA